MTSLFREAPNRKNDRNWYEYLCRNTKNDVINIRRWITGHVNVNALFTGKMHLAVLPYLQALHSKCYNDTKSRSRFSLDSDFTLGKDAPCRLLRFNYQN